jgi:ABC-2 type transport system ATP-binding protein
MPDSTIRLENLSMSFGEKPVLSDVSLRIQPGETFAFLGRNGAGKTTTIRILLGLLKPTSGHVTVAGFNPQTDAIELRKRVGYLAEDQTMYGWMTPVELARFLRPFYPNWDDTLTEQLLNRFQIPRLTRIERLSKGQSVKLGLALALAPRPDVVILDDPALGLDPIARKEFNRDLIDHLQAEGRTVFYSSHLLDEVEAVADSVAILDQGRIVRQEKTEVLREDVQRIVLSVEAASRLPRPAKLLDIRLHGGQVAAIVDDAPALTAALDKQGVAYEAMTMSLDEIFEAFVIGRPAGWPEANAPLVLV